MTHALRALPAPLQREPIGASDLAATAPTAPTTTTEHVTIRSNEMQSIHAELARSHAELTQASAAMHEQRRMSAALRAHRKAQRRAEQSALRARHLMALAVLR